MKKVIAAFLCINLFLTASACFANNESDIYTKKLNAIDLLVKQKKYSRALQEANKLSKVTHDEAQRNVINKQIEFISYKDAQQKLLNKFILTHDKYQHVTWYDFESYLKRPIKVTIVQFGDGELSFKVHFSIYYTGRTWMFINHACLYSDGETVDFTPEIGARNVDCYNYSECHFEENLWQNLDENGIKLLQKMANGNNVSLRVTGDNGSYKDFYIWPYNKKIITDTIEIYELLKNKEITQTDFKRHMSNPIFLF